MITLLDEFGHRRTALFHELLSRSNDVLAPLANPLSCELGLHAWLRPEREESYSMWLQWSLQQLKHWDLISGVLGLNTIPNRGTAPIEVDREVPIFYREDAGYGRLDLLIRQGSKTLCVIEVKTKRFSREDLLKQRAYSESPDVSSEAERIFLAVDWEGFNLNGFRPLRWSDLCIRLRRATRRVAGNEGCLAGALLLAFVGAIEQNLLGLVSHKGRDFGAIPRTVAHLRRFLDTPGDHDGE